ncbi:MAG: hypothetical protein LBQ89_06635 [Treponema sp.]|jgi:hypothetical protein|nr:hypothetical protein [Treponema sp.]
MGKAQVQPYPRGPNFKTVWATLDRITKRQEEIDLIVKETARRQEETAREMKETARQIKDYNKRFGDFHNRFGEIVEYMVAPNLQKKFKEYGFIFNETTSDRDFSNDDYNISFEVDVFLENGDKAMLVEVKTKLTTEKVKEHVKRLEKMRAYADLKGDKRAFLGAVAGVVMTANAKKYALAQGFYVIEPSGETFNITPPSQLKEW